MGKVVLAMNDLFDKIAWQEIDEDFKLWFEQKLSVQLTPMDSGLEADVFKIQAFESMFVLKVWNRASKPDISIQYKLLASLYKQGMAVSKPIAWGKDEHRNSVLLTSYDGTPVNKVNKWKLVELARILTEIHNFPAEIISSLSLPEYEFVPYFFPGIEEHGDIKDCLLPLVEKSGMKRKCLIHGDYNMGNILESEDSKYTIIDWTNIQLGDPRYDIAWSVILIWIYAGERLASTYRSAFLEQMVDKSEELEAFEAIACLRWILLNRTADLPKRSNTVPTVRSILQKNKFLSENLL